MENKKLRIYCPNGLHLREAARVVTAARKFISKIQIWHNSTKADTHSILEVLLLGAPQNSEITLVIEGADEKEAMNELMQIFQDGGGI
ncbi:MAG: HPr family phosphocarrier protein [Candidatus Omnitrophica bacterium]|nr:HPr family phosphocarrier protein [Candidatus Omnitrophota bacterium]